ncbi:Ketosamine-3-kinase [Apostichopus japonicus]|uniref:protein-ribulosamine 3-kinase n=1 Tax=Stichopus japonicus TaxID=307972 RepID=A0A2G8LLA9_STIJA|nr:Ketosamine-3-kinase [Apostichopus japonicus]
MVEYLSKSNTNTEARQMFDGEEASLKALTETNTVRVPNPLRVCSHPDGSGAVFIMEHLDLKSLRSHSGKLGEQLARLHLHNNSLKQKEEKEESRVGGQFDDNTGTRKENCAVSDFGFPVTTCCGYLPQDNSWSSSWVNFYTNQKLGQQMDMVEKKCGDREARELWPQLQRQIPHLFEGVEVVPALLHGDLWGGNVGELETEPVIFDPTCFYGHSEYEFGITTMFGGFSSSFFSSYHKLIPKAAGFEERQQLYQLFHYLNHWNHFGSGYRSSSLSIMRKLIK